MTSRTIQQQLDTNGFCRVPALPYPEVHLLDEPLRIRPNQRLEGNGNCSRLHYTGDGPDAIIFGERGQPLYAASLANFQVSGGAVRINQAAQHCLLEKVWGSNARGNGFTITADGEFLALRDCVAWECGGHGCTVECDGANAGLLFDRCNFQNNFADGLHLRTTKRDAELTRNRIRDCVIQGNKGVQVRLAGYVNATMFEGGWIEDTRPDAPPAVKCEAVAFDDVGGIITRRPTRPDFDKWITIALPSAPDGAVAIDLVESLFPRLQQLDASPNTKVCIALPFGGETVGDGLGVLPAQRMTGVPIRRAIGR